MYQRTSVHRIAVAGVPANEISFSVTEDSVYQVAGARVQDPKFLLNETVTTTKNIKSRK